LAFVMHGLGGFKEQDHIATFADAFKEKGFTVVRFDTTNTLGESGGKYENATITNYYEDLEDVIKWAQEQKWYQEPFALSGHSLGGICTALYAEKYPKKVLALALISTVVSGKLSIEAHKRDDAEDFSNWEKTGWKEEQSRSKPGVIKRLPWSHIADRLKYNLLSNVSKLTMPVLLITGENDTSTPPDHVQILFEALPGPKEYHIIKNAPHTFRDKKHLAEIKNLFLKWVDKATNQGESSDEYFDIVDENNSPTGERRLRSEAHSKGLWHRTVHIYLFKKTDEIEFLVHFRSKTKDLNPNKWDTRFGGHLKAGESIQNAIKEELQDEVSLILEPSNLIQGETYKRDKYPNREFTNAYYYKFEGEVSLLKFNDGEVQEVKWMKSSTILESMSKEPEIWSGSKSGFTEIFNVLKSILKN
ncbi:MAG: hypothetical protein A2939_02195, partial [Parcubacteria group bacterium RIFCSPLOWO2_01_FULL_48_18]